MWSSSLIKNIALCFLLLALLSSCEEPRPVRNEAEQPAPTAPTPVRTDNLGQYSGVLLTPAGHYTLKVESERTSAVVTLGDITYRLAANHSAARKKRTLANLDLAMTVNPGQPGDPIQLEFVRDGQPLKRTLYRVADHPDVHNYVSDSMALTMSPSTFTLLRLDENGRPMAISGKVKKVDESTVRLEDRKGDEVTVLTKEEQGWSGADQVFRLVGE